MRSGKATIASRSGKGLGGGCMRGTQSSRRGRERVSLSMSLGRGSEWWTGRVSRGRMGSSGHQEEAQRLERKSPLDPWTHTSCPVVLPSFQYLLQTTGKQTGAAEVSGHPLWIPPNLCRPQHMDFKDFTSPQYRGHETHGTHRNTQAVSQGWSDRLTSGTMRLRTQIPESRARGTLGWNSRIPGL